jgi:Zn-finger nucleic acid-binding protein
MNCPACKNTLRAKNTGGMTVDTCYGGCGGIWFDAAELERVSVNAPAASTLHSVWKIEDAPVKPAGLRLCPRCPDQMLDKRWYSDRKQVEIDRCPNCRGIWLDEGEFTLIYDEVKQERETSPLWLSALEVIATDKGQPAVPDDRQSV